MLRLGETVRLTPLNRVRLALLPEGARLRDEWGQLYKKKAVGLEMTLGHNKQGTILQLYALPGE